MFVENLSFVYHYSRNVSLAIVIKADLSLQRATNSPEYVTVVLASLATNVTAPLMVGTLTGVE